MNRNSLYREKIFLKNLFGHSVTQLALTAVPILMLPYLTRMLGLEHFGQFVYGLAIAHLIENIVAYGFRFSATAKVSESQSSLELAKLFWTVFFAKFFIFFIVVFLCFVYLNFFSELDQLLMPGAMIILMVIGNIFASAWFFNGVQQANLYAMAVALGRFTYIGLAVIAVNGPDDLGMAYLAYGAGHFVSGCAGFRFARKFYTVPFQRPSARMLYDQLIKGKDVFAAQILVASYTSVNLVILGWFAAPAAIATYAVGERVYRFVSSLASPFQRALFPVLNRLESSGGLARDMPIKTLVYQFYVFSACSVAIAWFAEEILFLITGIIPNSDDILLLRILISATPFFATTALGTYFLTTFKKTKHLRVAVTIAAITNISLIFPALSIYGVLGLGCLVVFVQLLLSILIFSVLRS